MTLRDVRLSDMDALLALEAACYPPGEAFTRDVYAHALNGARAVNLAWEANGAVVGFVGAFHHKRWRAGHVYTLNVRPDARRRGIGRALMQECERRLADMGMARLALEVQAENAPAITLYEALGYRRLRLLEGYYRHYANNDAWLYEKELKIKKWIAPPKERDR